MSSLSLDMLVPDLRSLITLPTKLARELFFFLRNMKIHDRCGSCKENGVL